MGRTKWSEIRQAATPETLEAAARKKEQLEAVYGLRDLARELGLTQEALAERLQTKQGNVSRMLRRHDMHLSTLREVLQAMDAQLEVHARLKDGRDVHLTQFETPDAGA